MHHTEKIYRTALYPETYKSVGGAFISGCDKLFVKFIDQHSMITEPLRLLMKHDVKFEWTDKQEQAFNNLKDTLSSDKIITYFDTRKETELCMLAYVMYLRY